MQTSVCEISLFRRPGQVLAKCENIPIAHKKWPSTSHFEAWGWLVSQLRHFHIQIQNFVLLLCKFCLKTHQISFCSSSLKTQFWEFFTATNFSEENNLISSKIVNGSGKGFSEGREAAWMEKKIRLSPGTENLALSFQKKKRSSNPSLFQEMDTERASENSEILYWWFTCRSRIQNDHLVSDQWGST